MTTITEAVADYIEEICADYRDWHRNPACAQLSETQIARRTAMIEDFENTIKYNVGKKYIKVVRERGGVHSFIVAVTNDAKFQYGDILKPAGYNSPTRNFSRGNIFGEYETHWTGAV
ncbi:MAG: hypothetical protein COA84_13520 [Robiginitomaculum sp.]|nr:MAG: hypothetical protein COA84_13520 [Robiginitomaculum sp.]